MNNNDYVQDYLMHHGVKGQRWGVRKAEDKLQIQKRKTKIAELKSLESASKRKEIENRKSPEQVSKEKRHQAKKIVGTILTTGVLATLTVGALIKHERKTWAKGSKSVKKILKKGRK